LKDIETDLEKIKAQLIVSEKDQKAQAINTEGTQETLANWKRAGDDILRDRNEEQ
jgi:hypothetical protein